MVLILQVKKLRHREGKKLPRVTQLTGVVLGFQLVLRLELLTPARSSDILLSLKTFPQTRDGT